jgi:hypothetical protein
MTVWLVNPVTDDTSAAGAYGSVRCISKRYVYSDEIVEQELPAFVRHNLLLAAREFQPEHDFLLLAGDHLQVAVMSAMLMRLHGEFRVLRWDRIARGYLSVRIPDVRVMA